MDNSLPSQEVSATPPVNPIPQQNAFIKSPKRSFFSSKLFLIPFTLFIIALSSGTTYYFLNSKKETPAPSVTAITPAPTSEIKPTEQTTAPTTTQDETANWKIYDSNQYGFQFMYPPNFKVEGPVNEAPIEYYIWPIIKPGFHYSPISVLLYPESIYPYDNLLSVYGIKKAQGGYAYQYGHIQQAKVDGISGIDFEFPKSFESKDYKGRMSANYRTIIVRKGKYTFLLEGIEDYQDLFSKMISTFKFTNQNQTDETANWKTYSDNNFLIKYPSNWFTYLDPSGSGAVTFSDIQNPRDIPAKIAPTGHEIITIFPQKGQMPSTFPYTNGSSANSTVKPFSINGYSGIKGQQASTLGLSENVYLQNPNGSYVQILNEIGNLSNFDQMLSTFKFTQ